jgi:hypothetical protein
MCNPLSEELRCGILWLSMSCLHSLDPETKKDYRANRKMLWITGSMSLSTSLLHMVSARMFFS